MRPFPTSVIVIVVACASALAQIPPLTAQLVGSSSNGLNEPIFVCSPPGDATRLFVVQKDGLIKVRTPQNQAGTWGTFLDLSSLVSSGLEQGLLGMAFHPGYANNGYFFVKYTGQNGDVTIARYERSPGNPDVASTTDTPVLTVAHPQENHNGGCIQFGPDGMLYIGLGDGGDGNDANGQNVNTLLGKMLRIDVNSLPYTIPAGNPFVGIGGEDEIWAIGLRNPFRFSFDRLTGDLWIGDVGQWSWEEVNFDAALGPGAAGTPGRNYGWCCREGFGPNTSCSPNPCNPPNTTDPIHVFPTASSCVIGGYVYRGCAIPQLRGHYFFAEHLGNACHIWTLHKNGAAVAVTDRTTEFDPPAPPIVRRISSFGEDAAGEIYFCELVDNRVWKIVASTPQSVGVTSYGTGTAGCSGPSTLTFSCSPALLSPTTALTGTQGPPNSIALTILGFVPMPEGSDPLGVGLNTLVHPLATPPPIFVDTFVDASGQAVQPLPIPNIPGLAGWSLYAQQYFVWNSGLCTLPTAYNLSSTPGLQLTFQP